MNRLAACVSLLLALFIVAAGGGAKNAWAAASTGSVSGKVLDQNGSAVSGAKVTIKNLDNDSIQNTVTDANGSYQAENLPLGRYMVTAELSNGGTVVLNAVDMSADSSSPTAATASSSTAQLTATVIVNAQAPLVEKAMSQLDNTINTKGILELPGRLSLNRLAILQPGVVPNRQTFFGSPYTGVVDSLNYDSAANGAPAPEFGSGFVVNGTRPNSNYFTIDGSYNMDPILGTNRQSMPPEAMQTFEMVTGNFPAQDGRFGGSYLDQVSRSGNTGIHGTMMYTWAGNTLDGFSRAQERTFQGLEAAGFDTALASRLAQPVIVDNRASASVGLPVWKNKAFSFTSWDQDWFRETSNPTSIGITPDGIASLQGFALAPGALNTLTSLFPTANTPVARGQFNVLLPTPLGFTAPTTLPLDEFNLGLAGGTPYRRNYWRLLQHFDVKLSEKNSLNLRYLYDNLKDPGYPTALPGQAIGRHFNTHSGELNDVYIVSPTLVNEARFSVARTADRFDSFFNGTGLNIGGFGTIGNPNFPQNRVDNAYQAADFISWSLPHHTLTFGGDAINYRTRDIFPFNENGTLTYSSLTDFLLNQNAAFSQYTGNDLIATNATEIGVFAQDNWKVNKSFSLNLGLRYEYMQIPSGLFSGVLPSKANFGPRFGFAWAPNVGGRWLKNTTIRGGYSIMYDQEVAWQMLPLVARNFPNGINTVIGPVSGLTALPLPVTVDQFLASGGNPNLLPTTIVATDPNRRFETPYYQTYTLGLEREFGRDFVFRAFYVGTKGTHLYSQFEANPGVTPDAFAANPGFFTGLGLQPVIGPDGTTITSYRLNPAFGSIMTLSPGANSNYNSGQFSLIKRFSYGIQFGANYTYSKLLSYSDNFLVPLANPFDIKANYGRSDYDQPHRFSANYLFTVPTIWRDRPIISRLISGWELSGVTSVASGFPYSVINTQNALGLLPGQNPFLFTQFASINPFGITGTATSLGVINPEFIANPTNSGILSNQGRNILRGGRFINTDMAFVKNTRTFSEDQSLQFRFEVFNVFNHKSFTDVPYSTVNAFTDMTRFLNFGETNALGRSMMFSARYFF
jgi:outer membrane receptor protein involved in Fe transport